MVKTEHAILLIILLGLLLRLPYLEVLPYWDWDEGVNQNIAWNLANGRTRWFALDYAWVPHPPLYLAVCAVTLETLGNALYSMRLLSVFYSLLTIILVYLLGREIAGRNTGLLAALLYAIYPKAVYWNRMAFANNQLAFLSALALYSLLVYFRSGRVRWLYLCCIALGLSLVTGYTGLSFLVSALVLVRWYRHGDELGTLAFSIIPFGLYALAMLWSSPDYFLHDLSFHFGRFSTAGAVAFLAGVPLFLKYSDKVKTWFEGYFHVRGGLGRSVLLFYLPLTLLAIILPPSDITTLEAVDYYWVTSILGLVFIENAMHRTSLWTFHITYLLVLIGFNRADHMVIPAYPIMALGVGIFLARLYESRERLFKGVWSRYGSKALAAVAAVVVCYPIAFLLYHDVNSFILQNGLASVSLEDVNSLNDYINRNVGDDDLVLTYSYFAPYLKCRTSVLQQAIAYEGTAISYYPGDFKPERFAFNTSIHRAKYMVLSDGTIDLLEKEGHSEVANEIRRWNVVYRTKIAEKEMPAVYGLVGRLTGTPVVYETGGYAVYKNPEN